MRKASFCGLVIAIMVMIGAPGMFVAQDYGQDARVTPPPTRKIEPPPANASSAELEEKGDQLRSEKAYLDAVDYYQEAIKKMRKGPQQAIVYNKLGMALLGLGRIDDARKSYKKAVKADSKLAYAVNNLGFTYYYGKKYGRAIKYYKKAIKLEPMIASFHSNLGAAYFANKDVNKAVPEYQQALTLDPDIFERRSTFGQTAQISSPEDRAYYSYIMAKLYAQHGLMDRSLLYLRRAIEEGYQGIDNVYKDTEFTALREDPRFTELMTQKPQSIE